MRALSLFIALGVVGCESPGASDDVGDLGGSGGGDPGGGDPGSSDPGNDGHDQLLGLEGSQTQGRYLLGEVLDVAGREPGYLANALGDAVTATGEAVKVQFDGSASLRSGDHRGADPFFNGMLLSGSEGARLRITVVRGGYDLAFYRLEARSNGAWVDLCKGGDAIPLAGKWQKSGFHERAADRISFACSESVAYKCTLWGYLAGGDDTSLAWRAHQACTRMARSDYCANGVSHTRPGTAIRIYDVIGVSSMPPPHFEGVQNWPPNVGRMFFEAAWNDGAHPASCLSRLRWNSLPLGTLCSTDELRDPRLDTGVKFCEDIEWPAPGKEPTGALLFNESYYDDLALHVWQLGDDQVATVRGYYQMPGLIPPFPRLGGYTHVRNDGIIVRKLRDGLDPADFEELHLYGRAGDRVVAGVSQPPPDFEDLGFEGFARKVNMGGVAFNLYRSSNDYLSTTGVPPANYVLQWRIGYVMPPEAP